MIILLNSMNLIKASDSNDFNWHPRSNPNQSLLKRHIFIYIFLFIYNKVVIVLILFGLERGIKLMYYYFQIYFSGF